MKFKTSYFYNTVISRELSVAHRPIAHNKKKMTEGRYFGKSITLLTVHYVPFGNANGSVWIELIVAETEN